MSATRGTRSGFGWALFSAACALLGPLGAPASAWADDTHAQPSGDAPASAPRSRLTLRGVWRSESTMQKNFLLGRTLDAASTGDESDFDAFWTQELKLYPRLILSDNLNVNLAWTLGQGVWGLDQDPAGDETYAGQFAHKGTFVPFHLDWAYLAFRHPGTKTRWYIGRQDFSLGNRIVLDENADGLQIHREFPGLNSTLALAWAKESEGADGLTDQKRTGATGGGPDGRDADLWFTRWDFATSGGGFKLSPFFASYNDRGNADGSTLLPDGYLLDARFRPNISTAKVFGASLALRRGILQIDAELDQLSGTDRVPNTDSGTFERFDVNNGDLTGSNLYARFALAASRIELGGTFAQGSGDDDPRTGEGNINSLHTNGYFGLTEIWEDTIALDEQGIAPGGLGSPYVRGYRGLENTRVLQAHAALQATRGTRVTGSFSLIRATKAIRGWADGNADGVISADEFGTGISTQLGSEIDGRIDWKLSNDATLSLRGGMFFPREAVGWLIHGTAKYQEASQELRLLLTVPIHEFSLGG